MNTQTTLNAERVNEVFMDCLFRSGEDRSQKVEVKGIVTIVTFNLERLKIHQNEIVAMLNELPKEFQENGGGGWSFLNACKDKYGNQWTGSQKTMEQLFQIGIGIGKVKIPIPQEMWNFLPGMMPYYSVHRLIKFNERAKFQ